MPIRQVIQLLALFALCLAIVGIAWASAAKLYLFIPTRSGTLHAPPTHPGAILCLLCFSLIMTYFFRQNGLYVFFVMVVSLLLGSAVGLFAFGWTPSWAQHALTAGMIATGIYAWQQRDYFDE